MNRNPTPDSDWHLAALADLPLFGEAHVEPDDGHDHDRSAARAAVMTTASVDSAPR